MNKTNLIKTTHLGEAKAALAALKPQLPWPKLAEQLDVGDLALPNIDHATSSLPELEYPQALLETMGTYVFGLLPDHWKTAFFARRQRFRRNTQLARLYPICRHCGPNDWDDLDGIAAGALLMAIRPMPGPLRAGLLRRSLTHSWGAYLGCHGMVMTDEQERLLNMVGTDPRLSAALWESHPELAAPLMTLALGRCDLWSASMALNHPQAAQWLGQVVTQAATNEVAAMTALVLQPSVPAALKDVWVDRLRRGQPRCAYQAARWTHVTWPPSLWENLRDQLRSTAVSDRGWAWFHWQR